MKPLIAVAALLAIAYSFGMLPASIYSAVEPKIIENTGETCIISPWGSGQDVTATLSCPAYANIDGCKVLQEMRDGPCSGGWMEMAKLEPGASYTLHTYGADKCSKCGKLQLYTLRYVGNLVCEPEENCLTAPQDCGKCPSIPEMTSGKTQSLLLFQIANFFTNIWRTVAGWVS